MTVVEMSLTSDAKRLSRWTEPKKSDGTMFSVDKVTWRRWLADGGSVEKKKRSK